VCLNFDDILKTGGLLYLLPPVPLFAVAPNTSGAAASIAFSSKDFF
jgi:hypothetical protein